MGGMSAQIPIKSDPKANEIAMDKVKADKLREVTAGHDGTWIAHPLIHDIARKVFDEHMVGPHQVGHPLIFVLPGQLRLFVSTMYSARTSGSRLQILRTPMCRARLPWTGFIPMFPSR